MALYDPSATRSAIQVLTDALPYPAWLLSDDFALEYANAAFRAFSGMTADQARTMGARLTLAHPDNSSQGEKCLSHPCRLPRRVAPKIRLQWDVNISHRALSIAAGEAIRPIDS